MGIDRERFREALIARVHASGISVSELARKTGISKSQLDKLMQRRVITTNVDDATKLAKFFGETVEDFMRMGETPAEASTSLARLRVLASQLTQPEQDMLEAQIAGLLARRGPPR